MTRCPVGENCLGCQYAENCAHPEVQAGRLRAEVERLTLERDALQSQFDRMSAVADEFRHQRDRAYEESAAIGVALDETRAAALEEAAGIAAGFMRPTEGRIIAAAIRAAAKEEER